MNKYKMFFKWRNETFVFYLKKEEFIFRVVQHPSSLYKDEVDFYINKLYKVYIGCEITLKIINA